MSAYKVVKKEKTTKQLVSKEKGIKTNLDYFGTSRNQTVVQLKLEDYVTDLKIQIDQFVYEMYKAAKNNPSVMKKSQVDDLNILSIQYIRDNTQAEAEKNFDDYKITVLSKWSSGSLVGVDSLINTAVIAVNNYLSKYRNGDEVPTMGDMQSSYNSSNQNEYERHREKPGEEKQKKQYNLLGRKLFLRNLNGSAGAERVFKSVDKLTGKDSKAEESVKKEAVSEKKESAARNLLGNNHTRLVPVLYAPKWNAILNDAFIGGGIDIGARFKIDDIAQNSQDYIISLMDSCEKNEDKEMKFLSWCHKTTTDLALKKENANANSTITVLAREIGQLIGKGYVFKKIGSGFQAFHSPKKANATTYASAKEMQKHKIYGADFPNDSTVADEIASAFTAGYRIFDCAYTYKPLDFTKLSLEQKRKIKIIYKYKHEDVNKMEGILAGYKESGVQIDTIMLHEIPNSEYSAALSNLSTLCTKYSASAGISNVPSYLLDYTIDFLNETGIKLTRIENKVNLLDDDCDVRKKALAANIAYAGYGLFGAAPSTGTCGSTQQDLLDEAYDLRYDPVLLHIAKSEKKSVQYVVYGWAETQGIDLIARSADKGRQQENFDNHPLSHESIEILKTFGAGKQSDYFYEWIFDKEAANVLQAVWGNNAKPIFYKEVACVFGIKQEEQEAVLKDVSWLKDHKIDLSGNVKTIFDTILLYAKWKNEGYKLHFSFPEDSLNKEILKSWNERFWVTHEDFSPINWEELSEKDVYTVWDKIANTQQRYIFDKATNCLTKTEQV